MSEHTERCEVPTSDELKKAMHCDRSECAKMFMAYLGDSVYVWPEGLKCPNGFAGIPPLEKTAFDELKAFHIRYPLDNTSHGEIGFGWFAFKPVYIKSAAFSESGEGTLSTL